MNKRILLIGASGFIGRHLYKILKLYYDVIGVGFKHVYSPIVYSDVTKYKMVKQDILGYKPDFIIFAAGNKDLKASYRDLYRDNVVPVKNIYKVISKYNLKTKVIFLSTDAVFDGQCGWNYDSLLPYPVSNYGKTKFLAEQALEPHPVHFGLSNPVDYRIIRTSAVIGEGSLFLSWLLESFKSYNSFAVYANRFLSPTSIELLTKSIVYLIDNWDKVRQPIIHICGKRMSRYEFSCLVKKAGDFKSNVCKDLYNAPCDSSIIPSDIQKKIKYKPMEQYLKEIL